MRIPYPANIYVANAIKSAINELENTVKRCGELVHPDAKLTPSAKAYFEKQGAEAQKIITELHLQIADITS